MRKCKFNAGHTRWQDGIFHRWYETGGNSNILTVVFEDSTGLVHNLVASTVRIKFVEAPKETTVALQVPNELKNAFIELLEVVLSAHLYNPPDKLESDEKRVLDIIEAFVEREVGAFNGTN